MIAKYAGSLVQDWQLFYFNHMFYKYDSKTNDFSLMETLHVMFTFSEL